MPRRLGDLSRCRHISSSDVPGELLVALGQFADDLIRRVPPALARCHGAAVPPCRFSGIGLAQHLDHYEGPTSGPPPPSSSARPPTSPGSATKAPTPAIPAPPRYRCGQATGHATGSLAPATELRQPPHRRHPRPLPPRRSRLPRSGVASDETVLEHRRGRDLGHRRRSSYSFDEQSPERLCVTALLSDSHSARTEHRCHERDPAPDDAAPSRPRSSGSPESRDSWSPDRAPT